ncbi:hypothetical protein FA09DRAFT_358997 [Tilletiopsis washingtonensis]|uniref:CENP-V/GFA domain-containing protein n=1 Tax=Tilletiopsis washingtonensis TaxID=58919 RepID=A0A316ZET2_9BASI|nr:hypothetical protein FA09DRAFT_358997 [Tilletiopsis washingtonensis]PWO00261.1 hypothetical protein FA09DRAFT_358997 [Tilletiopsis washingtonensis]
MPFTGSCLCGACTYEYSGDAGPGIACHCTSCRRYTGGLASFNLGVEAAKHKWTKKDGLASYLDTCDKGEGPRRWFCSKCGSPLATTLEYDPKPMFLKAGALDDLDGVMPEISVHLFYPSAARATAKGWDFAGQTLLKGMPGSEQVSAK